jgi:hypothetical protein
VGLALLILVLKWGFSSNRKLVVTPIKAGKKDQYGLLKPLPTPRNYIEAQMALQKLIDRQLQEDEATEQEGFSIEETANPMEPILKRN